MISAEQQQLFELTRTRIQNNLTEISALTHGGYAPDEFFKRFLQLTIDSLSAQGGAVWFWQGEGWARLAEVNFSSSEYDKSGSVQRQTIDGLLTQIRQTRKNFVVSAGGPNEETNVTPFPFFYTPVIVGENVPVILQVWLRETGDPKSYRDISAFLGNLAAQAVIFLRNHQGIAASARNEELTLLLRMQASLLGELNPREVSNVLVNYASDLVKADLVCLFRCEGRRWKLISASNQDAVDEKSQQSRKLVNFASHLESSEKTMVASLKNCSDETEKQRWIEAGYDHAAWKLLKAPGYHADHLLCALRHEETPFNSLTAQLLDKMGEAAGKALDIAYHYHHMPFRRVLGLASKTVINWRARRRRRILILAGVLVLIGVVLFGIPVPLKISAECTVEPRVRMAAVAEASGKIVDVIVKEGAIVERGQILAKLEDEDYVTQLAVSEQQRLRWQVESARAQSSGNEAERKLAEVNLQREIEAIKRLNYLRAKTEITSPMQGVILTKNLSNREGESLQKGAVFCEISQLDQNDLVLHIRQTDIGDLIRALRAQGRLEVDFILYSYSQTHLMTQILSPESISQLPEIKKDHSFFLVRLPFPGGMAGDAVLKPGYTGKAKIRLGTSNLFYSWFRGFWNYWCVNWGV